MIRGSKPEEQDDEASLQNFLFKINVFLFVGTIAAIKTGNSFVKFKCLLFQTILFNSIYF
jgi:hypothetical protein